MNTIATVISLTGLAWAMGPNGKSRLLAAGDTISPEETLVTASTSRIELNFGDGRVLVLAGNKVESAEGDEVSAVPVIVLPEFEEGTNTLLPQQQGVFNDGHAFVQVVKIAEIIEADGVTPLTVSAIREVLNPLAMNWDREPEEPEEERYNRGGERNEYKPADMTPVNAPPKAVGTVPDQASEDDATETVILELENIFKDADNSHDELTFTVEGLPPGLSFDPSTGKITGTIDNSASQGGPRGDGKYQVTITATDPEGGSTTQNFEWTVSNPVPETVNDAGDTSKSVKLTVNAEEGVLNNDSDPDGDDLSVTGVVSGGEGDQSESGVGTPIKGEFGTLVLQPDGSYTYTPDLSNDTVWELPEGSQLTDSFTYTISDGEGGFATAELVINITGHSNTPPFLTPNDANGPSIAGEITVYEKGLQDGTDPGSGHIASGTIGVAALDGLESITIAGEEITLDQLQGLADNPITIDMPGGSITLTGFDPMTAMILGEEKTLGGKLSYDYQLTQDQDHASGDGNSLVLDIQLGVKDDQGAISVADDNKLIVNVIDDAPVADNDINAITEDEASVTGNVLDNDSPGADGALVTGVQAGVVANGVHVADGNLGTEITGKYGTLTLNPDGSYSYKLDNSNLTVQGLTEGEALNDEVFSYTITEGKEDDDKSTATLTITINGTDDGVTVDVPNDVTATTPDGNITDQVVFESALSNGSSPSVADTRVSNQFTLVALDGLADVTISYTDVNGQPATLTLSKAQVEGLDTANQTITTQYGELVLNGVSQGTDGTITLDYDYTLTTAPEVAGADTNDRFTIAATDRDGDTNSGDLTIKIVDDAPEARDDTNSITEDAVSVAGNVIANGAVTDVADISGADGATVTGITSINASGNTATETDGTLVIEGQYGTLTINADGSYTYQLDNSNLDVQGLIDGESLDEVFNYTLTDGDSDTSNANLTITINGKDDGVTVEVPNNNEATTPDANNEDQVVFESGLIDGSAPNALDTQVSNKFTLKALDGLAETAAVTISYTDVNGQPGTLTLSKAEVEGLGTTSQSIITEYGKLVLNGVSQSEDGTITLDYDYTLTMAPGVAGDATNDSFTIAATDRDGDTSSDNLTIKIMDDAPVIKADAAQLGNLEVDETDFADGKISATNPGFINGAFTTTEGADGATTTYSLEVVDGTASGLFDTATGKPILLYQEGSAVVGRVEGTPDEAFRIEIDASNGSVTLTQSRPLQHPENSDHDDPVSIAADAVKLHASATDGDGDTVKSDGISVGGQFTFKDDGPTLGDNLTENGFVIGNAIVDEKYLPSGSAANNSELTVIKDLPVDYGTDGAVNFNGKTGLTFTNTDALTSLGLTSGTKALTYSISADGHTIIAITDAPDSKPVFTVTLSVTADGTPQYEFILQGPLDHKLNEGGATADNIELPFDITATDGDGDSVDLKFKVEVVDDTPPTDIRQLEVDEDGSVFFSSADINQTTTSVTTDAKHGTVIIGNDGTITYQPNEDYRGEDSYTYTVTTASGTYERTVNITVKPVADAPLFADRADEGVVVTQEDTEHSLDLMLPDIKDKGATDQNSEDYGGSDYSELLGPITLKPAGTGFNAGATFKTGDIDLIPKDGVITVVIVDGDGNPLDGYHFNDIETLYPESEEGTYYLTQAEYGAITAVPAEDRHENFDVVVSVDSYEVDDAGNKLPDSQVSGTNGSNSQQTITVDVQAVTDAPEMSLTAAGNTGATSVSVVPATDTDNGKITVSMKEDGTLNLQEVLGETLKDTDGSESYWYDISGLPAGTVVTINGKKYTADSEGNISMPEADYMNTNNGGNPGFSIKLPKDYSNSIEDKVTITLNTKDSDGDSTVTTTTESVSVDLELTVTPVAGDVKAGDVETKEDTPVNFLKNVEVTDKGTGTEVINSVSFAIPDGWTVASPTNNGGWTMSGAGTEADPYTINFDDTLSEAEREAVLDGFTGTPPAHSSKDATIELTVTTTDTNGVNSDTKVTDLPVKVTVTPVAEKTDTDSDGANGVDVTINPDHEYATPGSEDTWLKLGTEDSSGFNLENNWANEDGKAPNTDGTGVTGGIGSEDTYALLTPYDVVDNNLQTNATGNELDGSVFKYSDGTNTFEVVFNGEPVKIPVEYLDTLEFKGPANFSGPVKIKVEAGTIDYDEDGPNTPTDMAVSGESWLNNIIINPAADQVTLKVKARVTTDEDVSVALNINPTSSDSDETFNVTISGIPAGAVIIYNGVEYSEAKGNITGGSLTIENFDASEQPTLVPPKDSNESINLKVEAVSVDTLTYIDKNGEEQTITSTADKSLSQELDINITVQGVPDEPELIVVTGKEYVEEVLDNAAEPNQVALNDLITSFGSGETSGDGSETVTLRLSGLPEGFSLVGAGSVLGGTGIDRVWVIDETQLGNVKIILPPNYSGSVSFTAQPVVTENDNDSETFFDPENIGFIVTPSPEAALSVSSNLTEDTIGKLDLSAVHQNGDTDEFISAVKIAVVPGFTFYSDAEGTTELVAVDGYYVISGEAVNSVYVKADANFSGNQELVVEYKVTDPSADLSKDPVSDDAVPAVESDWISGSHDLIVGAVTDSIGAALNTITAAVDDPEDSFNFDDTTDTATVNGSGKVTVKVDISQQADASANNQTDTDGSEQLTHMVIDGVPQGVSVDGAVQTGPGQWLLEINGSFSADTIAQNVVFNVTGAAGTVNSPITITGYSKDTGASSQKQAEISFNLDINQESGPGTELPDVSLTDKKTGQTEDTEFSLAEQVGGTITGGNVDQYQITVTLRTSPDDETVYTDADGKELTRTQVTENGQTVVLWTKSVNVASGENADTKLAGLLDSIKVQTPEHANNNNSPAGLPLDVTVSVHADGLSKQDQLKPTVSLTPATDPTTVTVAAAPVGEGENISLDIRLENQPDGDFSNVAGDTLYVQLGDTGLAGKLYNGDTELTPDVNGVYEIPLDASGQPPALTFRPDAGQPHQTGSLTVNAWINHTETGAGNTIKSEGTGTLTIEKSNSGFEATITAQGDEQTQDLTAPEPIKLELTGQGLVDTDEVIDAAFINGLPPGFVVYVGTDANNAGLASNAGKDANGNNIWSLPMGPSDLPAYIAVVPPKNWSGTLEDLKLTIMSGEAGLVPTGTEIGFGLVVNPVADGISLNPTLSFGDAGDVIKLNLNAAMKDPVANDFNGAVDGHTERTTLELSGFTDGEKTLFYIDGVELAADRVSFDSATGKHTISGLTQDELDGLSFVHSGITGDITVTATTQEVDASGNAVGVPSAPVSGTASINVSDKLPTTGNDKLLWTGEAINGRGGEDTIQLRFGEELTGSELATKLDNIEVIDMTSNGASKIDTLSASDVLNMTDADNILRIDGDAEDSLTLDMVTDGGWTKGTSDGTHTSYTATVGSDTITLEVSNTLVID